MFKKTLAGIFALILTGSATAVAFKPNTNSIVISEESEKRIARLNKQISDLEKQLVDLKKEMDFDIFKNDALLKQREQQLENLKQHLIELKENEQSIKEQISIIEEENKNNDLLKQITDKWNKMKNEVEHLKERIAEITKEFNDNFIKLISPKVGDTIPYTFLKLQHSNLWEQIYKGWVPLESLYGTQGFDYIEGRHIDYKTGSYKYIRYVSRSGKYGGRLAVKFWSKQQDDAEYMRQIFQKIAEENEEVFGNNKAYVVDSRQELETRLIVKKGFDVNQWFYLGEFDQKVKDYWAEEENKEDLLS